MAKERSMALKEELKQFSGNAKKEIKQLYEKIKQRPLTCIICIFVIVTAAILLIALPHCQVSGINNVTEKVTQENQSRATLAQILGGIAVGIGIYFAWGNLTTAREGQITERFTRAVNQLGAIDQSGNPSIEIRLGGIYALERIANESDKDYWPIMEILTAYVRKNSPVKLVGSQEKISLDVQAILNVIGKRRRRYKLYFEESGEETTLNLKYTFLRLADLNKAHLEGANLSYSNINYTTLLWTHLESAYLSSTNFEGASLDYAHLENSMLQDAHLEETDLNGTNLQGADLKKAYLQGANLREADLRGAKNLTVDQLSKVKTLYKAELDPELEEELRSKGYSHLLDDEPER